VAEIMHDEKAPHSARPSAAEALLARGWGRPIQPTVQALGGGKTFEQWLDELDGPAREAFDEALAEQDADPAQRRPDGTA
jgi:hypothetical protein